MTSVSGLTLYHHGSSACAAKVRFVLEEKLLPWESRYIDLMRGEQFHPDYLALNPKAVVPTLVHDGHVIPESTIICEYLEDTFPERQLHGATSLARAEVRQWTKRVDEELHPACSAITYVVSHRHTILRNGASSFDEFLAGGGAEVRAARERKWAWIQQGFSAPGVATQMQVYIGLLRRMERTLTQADWLVDDRFSLADIAMAPYVNRLQVLAMERVWGHGRMPGVADWYARIRARPAFAAAFQRWLPETLAAEMRANGERAWPDIEPLLV